MLKKSTFGQNKRYKNAIFSLLRTPNYQSFSYNSWFLYVQKYKVRLSKSVWEAFHFQFRSFLTKVYIFVQQKAWRVFHFKAS